MIRKLVLLDSFDIIWHAKITLHLVGPLKIYKWHVLLRIDKFEIHDKGNQKIKMSADNYCTYNPRLHAKQV